MRRLVAVVLIVWEPLHFAGEALGVLPTIAYRGTLAVLELLLHGVVAAISAAAGFALWNGSPDGRRLALVAVAAVAARSVQSVYVSVLPSSIPPGSEPVSAAVAIAVGLIAVVMLTRAPR